MRNFSLCFLFAQLRMRLKACVLSPWWKEERKWGGNKESVWVRNYWRAKYPGAPCCPDSPHLTADWWDAPRSGSTVSPTERGRRRYVLIPLDVPLCFIPTSPLSILPGMTDPSTPKEEPLFLSILFKLKRFASFAYLTFSNWLGIFVFLWKMRISTCPCEGNAGCPACCAEHWLITKAFIWFLFVK